MRRALQIFALVWAVLAVALVLVAAFGAFLAPGSVWHAFSMRLLARLSPFDTRVNTGVLVLILPAAAAALWASWLNRRGTRERGAREPEARKPEAREPEAHALDAQQLTALTRTFQEAAATTAVAAGRSFVAMLNQFFDRQPDGTMKPKVVRVQIDDDRYAVVPLVSLVPRVGFNLDTMRVRFRCTLRGDAAGEPPLAERLARLERGPVTVTPVPGQPGGKSTVVDVTIEFKPGEPPEAVTELLRAIEPSVVTTGGRGPSDRR